MQASDVGVDTCWSEADASDDEDVGEDTGWSEADASDKVSTVFLQSRVIA